MVYFGAVCLKLMMVAISCYIEPLFPGQQSSVLIAMPFNSEQSAPTDAEDLHRIPEKLQHGRRFWMREPFTDRNVRK